jgi:hypothetical protein
MSPAAAGSPAGGTGARVAAPNLPLHDRAGPMRVLLMRIVALVPLVLLAVVLRHYPFWPLPAAVATVAYAVVLWRRPAWWLLLVPAALPWLDLSTWTGWLYLDELDLMLLATAAVGYWRLAPQPRQARLPLMAVLLLGAVCACTAVALLRGLLPLAPLDSNAFASYNSNYNSLRAAKGLAWALVLLPLLLRTAGPGLAHLRTLLVPGMLLGLFSTALIHSRERSLFPGLLNFSTDYRPTASFVAMHTGGAALDAYLALAFPFVAFWLLNGARRWQSALALALLLMGLFTGFTTFSRDIWLAYAGSAATFACLVCGPRVVNGQLRPALLAAVALLLAALSFLLMRSFTSGGYRTLGALLALLCATLLTAGLPRTTPDPRRSPAWQLTAGATAGLLLLFAALFLVLRELEVPGWAKAPYLSMLAATLLSGGAGMAALVGPMQWRADASALAVGTYPPLALASLLVALHWGGMLAFADAAWVVAVAVALFLTGITRRQPAWRSNRASLTFGAGAATLLAMAIPVLGSSYMGVRMSTVAQDFELRTQHWSESLHLMPADWNTTLLGMGLGRYPQTYYWGNMQGVRPGSFRYQTDAVGNHFLRLAAPVHPRGYGEVLRHLQHVTLAPHTGYRLTLDVKRADSKAGLWLAVCERWLLYPQACVVPPLKLEPGDDQWHHYALDFDSAAMGVRRGPLSYLPGLGAPVQLELASAEQGGIVDIDNLSLRARAGGPELLRNGDFTAGQAGWFFSSDRDHLPWHVKNFYVHTYFEQGWLGTAAMVVLLLYAMGRMAAAAWHGDQLPAVILSALVGALLVGGFDSLVDVPKVQLLFFLLLAAGLAETRLRPGHGGGQTPAASPRSNGGSSGRTA